MTDQSEMGIKKLLAKRFHGAASIRGFNYQILYSIYWTLLELPNTEGSTTLEGIEDIDGNPSLKGVNSKALNIQVKYRSSSLSWTDFTKILLSYAEIYLIDPKRSLRVVTNNEPAHHVRKFLDNILKGIYKEKNLERKLNAVGIESNQHLNFLNSVDLHIRTYDNLEDKCVGLIIQNKASSIAIAKLGLASLTTWFYHCAAKRMTINYSDIQTNLAKVFETLSTATYDAFGQGLIERISWEHKSDTSRFYEGSSVCPGDIRDGLDVIRKSWLKKVEAAFLKSLTVIVKAPSGQGKSVLLLRYAYEFRNLESSYKINQLSSVSEVALIGRYLEAINHLGIPSLIIIDNISKHVSMCD